MTEQRVHPIVNNRVLGNLPPSTVPPTALPPANDSPLVAEILQALASAAQVALSDEALLVEERNTWQPESWLINCCWQQLADGATGNEALTLAALIVERHPNVPLQALYRLASQYQRQPALGPLLHHELQRWRYRLFHTHPEEANQIDRLLLVATSAALANELPLATACLERLDNLPKGWERVVARPDLREQLALAIVHIGPHPLTNDLINIAIRRFDDAGLQFIHAMTTLLTQELGTGHDLGKGQRTADRPEQSNTGPANERTTKLQRLLDHCLDTVRYATLISLQSRRLAALIFGQAGQVAEVLTQVATIESVQSAQRATGYAPTKDDPTILRQVKRTNANSDADFLVYTLRNAAHIMPLAQLNREDRLALADKLAMLGLQSDGWTAASAAATLVELGALRYAVEVIDHVSPYDPSRSEGLLMLVRGLMTLGEEALAAEQAKRALEWAKSLVVRNPERALTWGLAEIYLHHQQPLRALQLLEQWREPTGWRERLRKLRGRELDDDGLRNNRLRLHALLQLHGLQQQSDQNAASTNLPTAVTVRDLAAPDLAPADLAKEIQQLLRTLQRAAPRLLEGEALIHFYLHGLLQPLLAAGHYSAAWALLPELKQAVSAISGNKHAVRVQEVTTLLGELLQASEPRGVSAVAAPTSATLTSATGTLPSRAELQPIIEGFLRDLWRAGARRGLWQVVHTIEGTLPLLFQLEGPSALVTIAHAADAMQRRKLPPISTPITGSVENVKREA